MKITYKFVNGETKEIEVDEILGKEINNIQRNQESKSRAYRRRNLSLDYAINEQGIQYTDENNDPVKQIFDNSELKIDLKCLAEGMNLLTADQRDLVRRVFFNGEEQKTIANELGISKQAINDRLKKIYKKLLKNF